MTKGTSNTPNPNVKLVVNNSGQAVHSQATIIPSFPDVNKYGAPEKSYRNAKVACLALDIKFWYDIFHDRRRAEGAILGRWSGELSVY